MTTREELITKTPELNIERILEKDRRYVQKRRLEIGSIITDTEESIETWLSNPSLVIDSQFEALVEKLNVYKQKLESLNQIEKYIQ